MSSEKQSHHPTKSEQSPKKIKVSSASSDGLDKVRLGVGIAILVVSVFAVGLMTGRVWSSESIKSSTSGSKLFDFTGDTNDDGGNLTTSGKNALDFDMYWKIWNTMKYDYVDEMSVDEKEMFYGSIKGMVNSYGDPATIFLDPEETEAFTKGSAGNYFSGIGAELGYRDNRIVVISPLDGSPAEAAGLKAGDILLAVDDTEIKSNDTIYDVVLKIRGEAGTDVKIEIYRASEGKNREMTITRGDITVPSMSYEESEESGIYVIDLSRFTEASLADWVKIWDQTISEIEEKNPKGIILDLRGNPGGFFDAAVYAAEEFVGKGKVIAMQEDRAGQRDEYVADREGRFTDIPMVVLVNEGSASASEILSGALQQSGRATVIGVNTYGKGTAQSIIDYPDGSSLHITVLKWLLPDGTWLNTDNPIEPDIVVEISDEQFKAGEDPQLEKALEELR
ncbi:MAG: S41 family peptidase [Candidatus Dojkabacteria bacterium]|nr:MAG: S41 family peptidase [Candidatus Dojkabacteria bacterium]